MPGPLIQSTPGLPLELTEPERFALRNLLAKTIDETLPVVAAHPDAQGDIGEARAGIVDRAVSAGPALSASTEAVAPLSGRRRRALPGGHLEAGKQASPKCLSNLPTSKRRLFEVNAILAASCLAGSAAATLHA
jgi:hypothetical protein